MDHIQHVRVFLVQSTHVLWGWKLSTSLHNLCPEKILAFGKPENSVLSIFCQSRWPSRRFFFFAIRITYQCLCQKLAKTEHAINLLLAEASFYMPLWHLLPWLTRWMRTLYLATISSPVPPPNWLGNAFCIMIVNSMPKLVVVVDNLSICNLFLALCSLYQPISHWNLANWF